MALVAAEAFEEASRATNPTSGAAAVRAVCLPEEFVAVGLLVLGLSCCCCGVVAGLQLAQVCLWACKRVDRIWAVLCEHFSGLRTAQRAAIAPSAVVNELHKYKGK